MSRPSRMLFSHLQNLLFILLLVMATAARGEPGLEYGIVNIDRSVKRLSLDEHLLYIHDTAEHHYRLEEMLDLPHTLPWQATMADDAKPLLQGGLYWFRVTLVNTDSEPLRLLMQTKYPLINVADLYRIDAQGGVETIYADSGLEDQFSNRPIPHHHLLNELNIPAGEAVTLIWRIDSEPVLQFSASLWDPMTFGQWDMRVQLMHGLLYGMILVMAVYNLFLYFSTWQKSYFYYVAYVATMLYIIAAQQGHVYQYIAPGSSWAKVPIFGIVYSVNALMFGQFTISFLDLRKRARSLVLTIRILTALAVILPIVVMITNSLVLVVAALSITGLLYLAAMWAGIAVRRQGVISAGHFVIAIMVLAFAFIASNMAALGRIESNELTENLLAVGTTLMMVFLSLALADRINQLQKEVRDGNKTLLKANQEKMKAESELGKLKQQRIRLEQASSQARLESRSKSDFLATLSHEIRTPMHGVLGMTELMKSTPLDEQQTHYLNTIEHSGKALLSIINDLQDFAQIEAGKTELQVSSFNLETLIDDCISTFALRATEKNINFIADMDPAIEPVLRGDPTKLQQIILNLLSNAFKFTDRGNIVLTVRPTDKPAVNGVELKFEVRDSGIGLTDEEQQRLFTPFQHADQNTYGRYGGSGLGLSISKQLAELMDGHIGVSSEPGVGSRFWFTARLLIDENPDPGLLRKKSTLLRGKKLLLVDPDPVSADIITRLLKAWRMKVEHCDSYEKALATASQKGFDVILAEHNLGLNDGIALARQLREKGLLRSPFILMASGRQLKSQGELQDAGIEILLEKPVTFALLHDVLKRAFSNSQQRIAAATPEESGASNTSLKVLVVEDNLVNQMVIKGLLKKLEIEPDLATNGLEALSCYDKHPYDLVLMDCEMPEMDGYEASAQIRARERHNDRKRTAIVALSAHARSDYQQRASESGMDGYLTKPITLSELAMAIEKHVVGQLRP